MNNNSVENYQKQIQAARWVFTYFLDEYELSELRNEDGNDPFFNNRLPDGVKYVLYQLELCPTTNRYHYQGYLVLGRSQRFNWVKKLFHSLLENDRVHLERAMGTHENCEIYCSKSETRQLGPWRIGTYESRGQGRRSDLDRVQELIDGGASMDQVRREHFASWVKYRQAFSEYLGAVQAERDIKRFEPEHFRIPLLSFQETKTWLVHGVTNTGKTNFALAHFKQPLLVRDLEDLRSLTPNHDGIVFDDLDFRHLFFTAIKNLLDPDFPGVVHVRYQNVIIPAGMPRIFTHQHDDVLLPPSLSPMQIQAVKRLYKTFEVTMDLRLLLLAPDSDPDN